MAKKRQKKKRSQVRARDWEQNPDQAFSHDRARHRRALGSISDAAAQAQTDPLPEDFEPNALVIAHSKKWAFVQADDAEHLARIDERLEEQDESLLAPGDRVLIEWEGEEPWVRGIAPRTSKLSRPGGAHSRVERQVIAANVDLLIIVASADKPPFRPGLVDRYLIAAERGDVSPLLCVNKVDLARPPEDALAIYRELGVPIIETSCETGAGIAELREALRNKLSVLSGHSGVGKSSLLNHLDPELALHTREISETTQRGRHTTTGARLYEIGDGIRIIDTPGIRALGLEDIDPEDISYYFPEIAEMSMGCRYRNCTHAHEPHCAVQAAVEEGTLPRLRYDSYCRIRASLEAEDGLTPGRMTSKYQGYR